MFKVQLIKMSDKVINDKNNNQDIKFVVLKLLEIDKQTGVPTGEMQDKYLREGSELLSKVNFEFASYYEVDLSFSGKIINIRELDKKEKNN